MYPQSVTLHNADILDYCAGFHGQRYHAVITDPPYHLQSIAKRFGGPSATPASDVKNDGAFRRLSEGFMGKQWDSGDIAFNPETWGAVQKTMLPGAFLGAFSGGRSWHRLAVAIEDAGFIIHDSIFAWVYSSGMPKGTALDKYADKRAGVSEARRVIQTLYKDDIRGDNFNRSNGRIEYNRTLPASETGQIWHGFRHGFQSLKPAVEPIIVAQKPFAEAPLDSIFKHGAGAYNIPGVKHFQGMDLKYPMNFLPVHLPACHNSEDCAPGCPVLELGEAADFYYTINWQLEMKERLHQESGVHYAGKAQAAEREAGLIERTTHPTVKPVGLTHWLAKLFLPPAEFQPRRILVPFAGVGSEMAGALFADWEIIDGVEKDAGYVEQGRKRLEYFQQKKLAGDFQAYLNIV